MGVGGSVLIISCGYSMNDSRHTNLPRMLFSSFLAFLIIVLLVNAPVLHDFRGDDPTRSGVGLDEPNTAFLPVVGFLAVPAAFLVYNLTAEHNEAIYERSILHNPETGYIYGSEPRDLGPAVTSGAVLLVHGFIGSGSNFGCLPDSLAARGWHVRIMCLPGHGTKPSDMNGLTADSLLTAVEAEAASLKARYDTVVLIGHSMGGSLSVCAASQGYADRLVLCAPYFGVTYKKQYILAPEVWVDLVKPAVTWVHKSDAYIMVNRKEAKSSIESYRWVTLEAVDMLNDIGERAKSPSVLDRVGCPVLVLHSTGDEAASYAESKKAFDAMASREKTFHELTRSNHHLFFDFEHSEAIASILDFLGSPR